MSIRRLKRRSEFLLAAKGLSSARGAVLLQARDRDDGDPEIGVGFTATKRIGGSVVRNNAKRRLREAARLVLPLVAKPGHDYVLIARAGTPEREFLTLLEDLKSAAASLRPNDRPPRYGPRGKPAGRTPPAAAPADDDASTS